MIIKVRDLAEQKLKRNKFHLTIAWKRVEMKLWLAEANMRSKNLNIKNKQMQLNVHTHTQTDLLAPHVVHLDHCKIIAIAYKLNEMAIGEIVEQKSGPRKSNKYKFQAVITGCLCISNRN